MVKELIGKDLVPYIARIRKGGRDWVTVAGNVTCAPLTDVRVGGLR